MTKITPNMRTTMRNILEDSRQYDASSMRIGRDGRVTARKDADKTFNGKPAHRYFIGYVTDMVTTDGHRVAGY